MQIAGEGIEVKIGGGHGGIVAGRGAGQNGKDRSQGSGGSNQGSGGREKIFGGPLTYWNKSILYFLRFPCALIEEVEVERAVVRHGEAGKKSGYNR